MWSILACTTDESITGMKSKPIETQDIKTVPVVTAGSCRMKAACLSLIGKTGSRHVTRLPPRSDYMIRINGLRRNQSQTQFSVTPIVNNSPSRLQTSRQTSLDINMKAETNQMWQKVVQQKSKIHLKLTKRQWKKNISGNLDQSVELTAACGINVWRHGDYSALLIHLKPFAEDACHSVMHFICPEKWGVG